MLHERTIALPSSATSDEIEAAVRRIAEHLAAQGYRVLEAVQYPDPQYPRLVRHGYRYERPARG